MLKMGVCYATIYLTHCAFGGCIHGPNHDRFINHMPSFTLVGLHSLKHIKRLIAYSSIAHMGFVTLGLFLIMMVIGSHLDAARLAMNGALVQMVAHAFGSGALFGVWFDVSTHQNKNVLQMAGLAQLMPAASVAFTVCLTNVALPGTAGFVGEFSVLMALARSSGMVGLSCRKHHGVIRHVYFMDVSTGVYGTIGAHCRAAG